MKDIIGVGDVGCNIALSMSRYGNYGVYLLDTKKYRRKTFLLEKHSQPEEYEKKFPDFKRFFSRLGSDVLLIFSGQDFESSIVLRLLESLREKRKITVLYVEPNFDMINETTRLHSRAIMGIIQQYARTGLLDRMYLVSSSNIEEAISDTSIALFKETYYNTIAYGFYMLKMYSDSESVISTIDLPHDAARISTIGVFDMEKNIENMFFSLDYPREINYYYGVSEELMKDTEYYKKIKDFIKSKKKQKQNIGYALYSTDTETSINLVVKHSSFIQE